MLPVALLVALPCLLGPPAELVPRLELAGANRAQIESALEQAEALPPLERSSVQWLVGHMPLVDLQSVTAARLVADATAAVAAWQSAPWAAAVPEAIFRDAILPFACVDEVREDWRARMRAIALPLVAGKTTLQSAATAINRELWSVIHVKYAGNRPKANQNLSESLETGLASCTGLSIALIEACRSVGIPARFVGCPLWKDNSGNHSWVEVWDGAAWRFTGAFEPSGEELDQGWFAERAATCSRENPLNAVYAVTWNDAPAQFAQAWTEGMPRTRGYDVTDRYTTRAAALAEGSARLYVGVRQQGKRVAMDVIAVGIDGKELGRGTSRDERFDLNDHLAFTVPLGKSVILHTGGGSTSMLCVVMDNPQTVFIDLPAAQVAPQLQP